MWSDTKKIETEKLSQTSSNEDSEPHKPLTRSQRMGVAPETPPSSPLKATRKKTASKANNTEPKLTAWGLVQILISEGLSDKDSNIRTLSLQCLKTLGKGLTLEKNIADFIEYILQFKKEISTDNLSLIHI